LHIFAGPKRSAELKVLALWHIAEVELCVVTAPIFSLAELWELWPVFAFFSLVEELLRMVN
jgi:hypothetical protein